MNKKFSTKNGTSIDIIIEKIGRGLQKKSQPIGAKKNVKSYKAGRIDVKDWKNICTGLEILERLSKESFRTQYNKILSGDEDVSKVRKELVKYKDVISDFIIRLQRGAINEYYIREQLETLGDYSQIAQAARDGIIIKQETREEKVDGELKEIIYDTSMTPREVVSILDDYKRQVDRIESKKLESYLGLGLGFAGMMATLIKKDDESNNKKTGKIIGLGTTAIAGLKLIQGTLGKTEREEAFRLRRQKSGMVYDLVRNEQMSSKAEENTIEVIRDLSTKELEAWNKSDNKELLFNVGTDLAVAIISGIYINKNIRIKENGKIDGKSLASAIVSLQATKGITGNLVKAIQSIQDTKKEEQEFQEICEKVKEIMLQMEEKVYPLQGAKCSFDAVEIKDFNGRFYPKKDYETGEIQFATTIRVPEFSMKRGDVVLLSGESGTGKSTFLRLLKRGDINNRNCIILNNEEKVDNLGNEYIAYRPSINLGDETNVLFQITGKTNISDLNEYEKGNLSKILKELDLDSQNIIEDLASKNFTQFSTGEQRRLALSKLLYRIDDGNSVIIVDEPVGNVEDRLIREQLELIKKYAIDKNAMLLLTTHRIDLAEDLVTKRYHINKDGLLEQVPVIHKDKTDIVGKPLEDDDSRY